MYNGLKLKSFNPQYKIMCMFTIRNINILSNELKNDDLKYKFQLKDQIFRKISFFKIIKIL